MLMRDVIQRLKKEGLPTRRQYLYEIIVDLESSDKQNFGRRGRLIDMTEEEYQVLKAEVMRRKAISGSKVEVK